MPPAGSPRPVGPLAKRPRATPFAGIGRIPVVDVGPVAEGGRWPARAVPGEAVPITATVFKEGHDSVGATAVLISPDGRDHSSVRMAEVNHGLARFEGRLVPDRTGEWSFRVEAWADPYSSWRHDALIKVPVGQDVETVFAEGARVMKRAAGRRGLAAEPKAVLETAAARLCDRGLNPQERLAAATEGTVAALMEADPLRDHVTKSAAYGLRVQRERALVGNWYELFPRSVGAYFSPARGWVSGTLRTCADGIGRVAAMGFDVLYLTPVHPIGETFRKGRNNALKALPGDPGSPYAIGSAAGGHDAIHPDLGTFEDFDYLVERAREHGMEVALDLALQCSPDHPWVTEHPEWFTHLPDGTIAYAENPPKKYQDIYPLNFDNDPEGIYQEILRVVRLWIAHGVTILRVDNPHTKPLPFWERLLAQLALEAPDVVALAEAFTRPPMMRTLALVGFHQSYTYFAWRNTKSEVLSYLTELAGPEGSFLRPAIWPTTHDILTPYMQKGGLNAFKIRAILAATYAPTWGIYSGYELAEDVARPGSEEQLDNEKYEYKERDFASPRAVFMSGLLGKLNAIRASHPALRHLRNVTVHPTSDDAVVAYSRRLAAEHSPTGQADTVLVVLSLDPSSVRESFIQLDLAALGLAHNLDDAAGPAFRAHDLLSGETYEWGARPFVRLDPHALPGHVIHVEPELGTVPNSGYARTSGQG
ncbi:MAG: alpha-1,4-glucan--maltose-1-phosphate maltosyltransferase [Bifidobacteriaceae bacterium]|jgi:starch synthase (maltosyl-transferring)|nr:alpha-1,4-glucan--maltose-1-phosphate maltosyltransferase [Bifidobacteriaceae bacterium]